LVRKYKYLFRLGRGSRTLDLLGPSISHFWNDIYDAFDNEREMFIERLDGRIFTIPEIKRLFRELSEDMEEDYAVIWLEIKNKGKQLRFIELETLGGFDLDEMQKLVSDYAMSLLDTTKIIHDSKEVRVLNFENNPICTVAFLVNLSDCEDSTIGSDMVKDFLTLIDSMSTANKAKMLLATYNTVDKDARALLEKSKITTLEPVEILRKINENNLNIALDEFQMDATMDSDTHFTTERFGFLLDILENANSNISKKNTLESLAEYFLNGVKGFKVLDRDYRGPSEEIDLLVANESNDPVLRDIGNPIAVECRHRKKPASSRDIRDFRGKLGDIGLKAGILITLKGVTGHQFDGVSVIRDARKTGVSIIVVAIEDLKRICEGKKPEEIIRDCFYKYL
jgi:hypothetical protein